MSVLLPYIAMQVCYAMLNCTWMLVILIGFATRRPHDSLTGYLAALSFGVLLVGLFESVARIMEVEMQATEAEDSRVKGSS
jgi:hypothetical protein